MNKILMTLLITLVSGAVKGLGANGKVSLEVAKLRASLIYLKSVNTFRGLFLSLLGVGACLVLLVVGFVLFHASLFLYAPWSAGTKLTVGLCCTAIYFGIAMYMFSYIFSEKKWLKIFHADRLAASLDMPSSSTENSADTTEDDDGKNGNGEYAEHKNTAHAHSHNL